ncbi:restriction endonuclease [Phycisphaerales bacterium AB-hyl4]|uniref:Restriction endonuclease n=1 Tax=Natronomicrosphaera hydrolytica TaxID=3242702 RepID=A0ABV4U086_9BACT
MIASNWGILMPRRKSDADRFLDGLFAFLRAMPWWVGPPCILIAWILFAWVVPGVLNLLSGEDTEPFLQQFFGIVSDVSAMLAPFAAGFVAVLWLAALVRKAVDARRLDRQTGIDSIRALSWQDFEQLLAEAFRWQGYRVYITAAGADGGVDLVLEKAGRRTLVQAKQWKSWKVGVKIVRELLGVQVAQQADEVVLATSGQLTREATAFAEANGIRVIDGPQLAELIASVQHMPDKPAAPAATPAPSAQPPDPGTDATAPCPACGAAMVQRTARQGKHAGKSFWGCTTFPACRSTKAMT